MADEQDKQQPSLELPGVFGRKKREKQTAGDPVPPPDPQPAPPAAVDPPVSERAAQPVTGPAAEPPTRPVVIGEIPDPPPDDAPDDPQRRSPWRRQAAPAVTDAGPDDTGTTREPVPVGAAPLFTTEPRADRSGSAGPAPSAPDVSDGPPEPSAKRSRPSLPSFSRPGSLPRLGGYASAAITGLVIGLLLVGLTFGALRGCEAVRGTATCGGGAGLFLLVLIMVLLIALGGLLLRAFGIPDPFSTSFLAMGMVAVISLLFLLGVLLSPWMLLVLPLLTIAMYAAAQWVTTAFVDVD